ncbi:hypothetical protein INT48_003388, partial [Thamnidium elegans]
MSESSDKRTSSEPDSTSVSDSNKKPKLDNNEASLTTATLPVLSDTLVLDKVQEDTINQLVQSSSESTSLPINAIEDTNKIMEQDIVSADIEKAVTAAVEPTAPPQANAEKAASNEDLNITSEQLLFALTSIPPTESGTTTEPKEAEAPNSSSDSPMQIDESMIVKELLAPNATTNSNPTAASPLPVLEVEVPPPPVPATLTAPAGLDATKPSIPLKTNSMTNSLTNLPDISAALRRLSSHTVPASVMEQLSSSPRLPNMGNLNTAERRGSMADVSPSEMLGNALAAVAANAAAASRSSPKQPQAQNNNAATAIGNLAAITANISNLLHSGGFHRNSFSQEDTQKLAAAVAVARNGQQQQQQQRRKSSMAAVGNAFSNMIEMMGRNKVSKPKLIIKNEQVWKYLEGREEKNLGVQVYSPQWMMPSLQGALNGLMEVRVPARYLTFENTRVKKRALWGTDIYTDDSDIVAMAIHSGKYQPRFIERDIELDDPFALAVAGKQRESVEAAKKLAQSGKKWIGHDHFIPDHDLKVTVRVLPTLQTYASSIRNRMKSRDWGKHDGMSLFVHKVEKIKRGDARLKGRSTIKSDMFAYEQYRKQALGLSTSQQQKMNRVSTDKLIIDKPITTPHLQRGRVKKTRRVMRMFQIRSEMLQGQKNNSIE